MSLQVEKHVSIFDSAHFRVWEAQMMAFLQSQGLWHITNGTWVCPTLNATATNQGELDAWDLKDEICNGQITLHLVQNVHTGTHCILGLYFLSLCRCMDVCIGSYTDSVHLHTLNRVYIGAYTHIHTSV